MLTLALGAVVLAIVVLAIIFLALLLQPRQGGGRDGS